ncbi:M15 family metallopeptidase, partial [Staphylococcus lugdunensis]
YDVGAIGSDANLREQFGETKEGQWIARHAHRYGFIVRYPKGKEQITGYQYEPWHLRYLGKNNATKVQQSGQSLEEYVKYKDRSEN